MGLSVEGSSGIICCIYCEEYAARPVKYNDYGQTISYKCYECNRSFSENARYKYRMDNSEHPSTNPNDY